MLPLRDGGRVCVPVSIGKHPVRKAEITDFLFFPLPDAPTAIEDSDANSKTSTNTVSSVPLLSCLLLKCCNLSRPISNSRPESVARLRLGHTIAAHLPGKCRSHILTRTH